MMSCENCEIQVKSSIYNWTRVTGWKLLISAQSLVLLCALKNLQMGKKLNYNKQKDTSQQPAPHLSYNVLKEDMSKL